MPITSNDRIFSNIARNFGQSTVDRIVAMINAGSPTLAAGLAEYSRLGWNPILIGTNGAGSVVQGRSELTTPGGSLSTNMSDQDLGQFISGLAHEIGHFVGKSTTNARYAVAGDSRSLYLAACFGAEGDALVFADSVRREFRSAATVTDSAVSGISIGTLGLTESEAVNLGDRLDEFRRELNRTTLTAAQIDSALGIYAAAVAKTPEALVGSVGQATESYKQYCSRYATSTSPAPDAALAVQGPFVPTFLDDFDSGNSSIEFLTRVGGSDVGSFSLQSSTGTIQIGNLVGQLGVIGGTNLAVKWSNEAGAEAAFSTESLDLPGNAVPGSLADPLTITNTTQVVNAINGVIGAIQGRQPISIATNGFNFVYAVANPETRQNLGSANVVVQGVGSLYGMYNAFQPGGSALSRASALGSSLNYVNTQWGTQLFGTAGSEGLSHILNGTPGLVEDAAGNIWQGGGTGLANGGVPGALPVISLVMSIKNKDPIGTVSGLISVINPAWMTPGVGWALAVGSLVFSLTRSAPDAWGVASVRFADGEDNLNIDVAAEGESFGKDKARQTQQTLVNALKDQIDAQNQLIKLGLAQGGANAASYDDAVPFSANPAAWQPDPTDTGQSVVGRVVTVDRLAVPSSCSQFDSYSRRIHEGWRSIWLENLATNDTGWRVRA